MDKRLRIGLIRHFPVTEQFPSGWKTARELQEWRERYESAPAIVGEFHVGDIGWRTCIASDLPRARLTAATVFSGDVEYTELLREPLLGTFQTGGLRLPVWAWKWVIRYTWLTGHASQRACRDEFKKRIQIMADRLVGVDKDTLVVSHLGVMAFLSAELCRRGFVGPKLRFAKHASVYVYEREAV